MSLRNKIYAQSVAQSIMSISDTELIHRAEVYAIDEGGTPSSKLVLGMCTNIKVRGHITKFEHTFITSFCISHEYAEAEYKNQIWKRRYYCHEPNGN